MAANLPKLEVVQRFFNGTGFSYDQVVTIFTLGFDKYWKKKIIDSIPARSVCIVDQACGTGIVTLKIARKFPDSRVIGVELRDEYLSIAREKARTSGIRNVEFILGRAEDIVIEGGCDCITSSYLAKYAELGTLMENAGKMLPPGGLIIMHDFTYPSNPLFLSIWKSLFKLMRIVGSKIFPEWQTVFHELPEFLRQTTWVSDSLAIMKENGFSDVTCKSLTFGTSAIITAKKP